MPAIGHRSPPVAPPPLVPAPVPVAPPVDAAPVPAPVDPVDAPELAVPAAVALVSPSFGPHESTSVSAKMKLPIRMQQS